MKQIANAIVIKRPTILNFLSPLTIAWWANVIEAPESNRITVFKRGTSKGLKTKIPTGGQIDPISITGDKLDAKNAQKKAKKRDMNC